MPTAIPEADFVGREDELARLRDAFEADERPVVVVHGEPGIGKTRLVREFARTVEHVLWGTCDQGRVGSPYAPWAEALGRRADPRDYDGVVAALDGGPVVVLDDLQWASEETLDLLVHVARFAPAPLIVVLHRGIEIESAPLSAIARRRECRLHRAREPVGGRGRGPGRGRRRVPRRARRARRDLRRERREPVLRPGARAAAAAPGSRAGRAARDRAARDRPAVGRALRAGAGDAPARRGLRAGLRVPRARDRDGL